MIAVRLVTGDAMKVSSSCSICLNSAFAATVAQAVAVDDGIGADLTNSVVCMFSLSDTFAVRGFLFVPVDS